MASLKERDRVQGGREVLVWQREEGKQKEDISEDTIFIFFGGGRVLKMYLMKLCLKL